MTGPSPVAVAVFSLRIRSRFSGSLGAPTRGRKTVGDIFNLRRVTCISEIRLQSVVARRHESSFFPLFAARRVGLLVKYRAFSLCFQELRAAGLDY